MKISLKPNWTTAEKTSLHRWIKAVMESSKLESNSVPYPLAGKVVLYVDGTARHLHPGPWQLADSLLYVGGGGRRATGNEQLTAPQRLAVVAQLIALLDAWEEYMPAFAALISKAMLEQYNELKSSVAGLVNAQLPATGIALNQKEGLLAAKMEEEWFLPNGEKAEVKGAGWVEMS